MHTSKQYIRQLWDIVLFVFFLKALLKRKISTTMIDFVYCVDLEVWSKLAKCVHIMCIALKCARDFDCDWQCVNVFSHCVTLICVLLSQIISHSDTKVSVLVVMECKGANVIYVYELIFLLHTSRSTECRQHECTMFWACVNYQSQGG